MTIGQIVGLLLIIISFALVLLIPEWWRRHRERKGKAPAAPGPS